VTHWTKIISLTLKYNLMSGNSLYKNVRINEKSLRYQIDESGQLEVRHFDMFKKNLQMYNETFSMCYESDESPYYGNIQDKYQEDDFGISLENALKHLFKNHTAGVLVASSKSFAVICSGTKYYFTDSHSCDQRGKPLSGDNGKSCVIECGDIFELIRKIKRATLFLNCQYTLDYIDIHRHHNMKKNDFDKEQEVEEFVDINQHRSTFKSNEIIVESHDTGFEKKGRRKKSPKRMKSG